MSRSALPHDLIAPPQAAKGEIALRLLQTTDLHARVFPHDYEHARIAKGGLASAAAVIARLRGDAALLFDCGDFLQGAALGDVSAQMGRPAPIIAAMNALDYDAVALGNHDFNFGYDYLSRALAAAQFPVVASNCMAPALTLPPRLMLQRDLPVEGGGQAQVQIGVIAALPPSTALWERSNLDAPLDVTPIVPALREQAQLLRAQGADLVVALVHSGFASLKIADPDAAAAHVAAIDEVDAVLAGHTHDLFPRPGTVSSDPLLTEGKILGTPCVMAGCFGRHVGVIDLVLKHDQGRWQPRAAASHVVPSTMGEAKMPAPVVQAHLAVRAKIDQPVGHLPHHVHSFFGLLGPDGVGQMVASAMLRAAQDHLGATPQIAMVPPFRYGWDGARSFVDLPAGPVKWRQCHGLYPYPNRLAVVQMRPDHLRAWLEQAVAQYARIVPGAWDVPLLAGKGYALDMAYGLEYEVDLAQPEGARLGAITLQGQPIEQHESLSIATTAFRSAGAPPFTALQDAQILLAKGPRVPDLIRAQIARGLPDALPPGRLQFAPIANASAVIQVPPAALPLLSTHPLAAQLEPLGPVDGGLHRLRLRLASQIETP